MTSFRRLLEAQEQMIFGGAKQARVMQPKLSNKLFDPRVVAQPGY